MNMWTIKKKLYRTQQNVMKLASVLIPVPIPNLLEGPGSVTQLAAVIASKKRKHALVVTDKVLMQLGLPKSMLESLDQAGIAYTIFDNVEANPTIESCEEGRDVYKSNDCDCIIAFGGGSPIDCAKIIGARIANPYMKVRWMKGMQKVFLPIPPLYCVSTTAGTGSETTIVAVITDAKTHEKFAISDLKLVPKTAVLDPELMVGLPPHITAATGMDALTHAIEAYISLNSNKFTDENAEKAVALIFQNLEEAYKNGGNIDAREAMAKASFYAGLAFTRAYIGYVHAIAHNMGGLYGVAHGLANAIILPYVLELSRESAKAKLAALAVIGGLGKAEEGAATLSQKIIDHVRSMNKAMKIPTFIKELKEEDIPLIAKRALKEAHPDYPVPLIITQPECEELVRKLLA